MLEIKPHRNTYGFMRAKCPFCSYEARLHEATKMNPDPLRDLKRHITNQAKNEALEVYASNDIKSKSPHLDYYKDHTTPKTIVVNNKRMYDNDLKVKP